MIHYRRGIVPEFASTADSAKNAADVLAATANITGELCFLFVFISLSFQIC